MWIVIPVALGLFAAAAIVVLVRRSHTRASPERPPGNPYADDRWPGAGGPDADWGPGP